MEKTKKDNGKCVLYMYRTREFHMPYYICNKCGFETTPNKVNYCPDCGRRVIAVEDKTLWQ